MRSISGAGLAKLATKHGNEPITIVEIDWEPGTATAYADRTVSTIPGRIIEVGELDDVINVTGNSGSQEVTVVLDDTDGTIKAILDAHNVHKHAARVYQYFSGLALSDRFLLFDGQVTSPIVWNERDRTVKVTILSQLEDLECGFNVDETGWIDGEPIPDTVPNDAWPMIFGTVTNNKAVQLRPPVSGQTTSAIGVLGGAELMIDSPDDPGLEFQLSIVKSNSQLDFVQFLINEFNTTFSSDEMSQAAVDSINEQYASIKAGYDRQYEQLYVSIVRRIAEWRASQVMTQNIRAAKTAEARLNGYGGNTVEISGGHNFPQGYVEANISGATFVGTMIGDMLSISSRRSDYLEDVAQGILNDMTNQSDIVPEPVTYSVPTLGGGSETITLFGVDRGIVSDTWEWSAQIPDGEGGLTQYTTFPTTCTITRNQNFYNIQPILQHQWIEAGASVQIYNQDSLVYGVSLIPGTVLAVKALCTVNGVQMLRDVTGYTVETVVVGGFNAVAIRLTQRLSGILNEQWSDDVYVTFQSAVGPNVSDIIAYLISTFSNLTCDAPSFAQVNTALAPYPANFAVNTTRNVLQLVQDIGYQACCSVRVVNGKVYLQYLRSAPSAVDTITESDIDAEQGVEVSLTPTEDLITKMTIKWAETPAPDLEQVYMKVWTGSVFANQLVSGNDSGALDRPTYRIVLRNNIDQYGVHDASYNYTIFENKATIQAFAWFWLHRKSNTWKQITFTTPLHKLNLEAFDVVNLSFTRNYIASGPVRGIIESATYDSKNNCVRFTCLTPVLAGTSGESASIFWS